MLVGNYIRFATDVFKKAGLAETEAEEEAWDSWAEFVKEDVKPEEELLLKAGVCPKCHKGGYLVPVDHPLKDYTCLNCGEDFFIIETLKDGE